MHNSLSTPAAHVGATKRSTLPSVVLTAPRERMAPKRGQRSRKVGLLGLELANSSDDDDYRPPGASSGAARRVAAAAAAAERTAEDVS